MPARIRIKGTTLLKTISGDLKFMRGSSRLGAKTEVGLCKKGTEQITETLQICHSMGSSKPRINSKLVIAEAQISQSQRELSTTGQSRLCQSLGETSDFEEAGSEICLGGAVDTADRYAIKESWVCGDNFLISLTSIRYGSTVAAHFATTWFPTCSPLSRHFALKWTSVSW